MVARADGVQGSDTLNYSLGSTRKRLDITEIQSSGLTLNTTTDTITLSAGTYILQAHLVFSFPTFNNADAAAAVLQVSGGTVRVGGGGDSSTSSLFEKGNRHIAYVGLYEFSITAQDGDLFVITASLEGSSLTNEEIDVTVGGTIVLVRRA